MQGEERGDDEHQQRKDRQQFLQAVNQAVAVERDDEAQGADQVDVAVGGQRADRLQRLGGEQGVADEESQVDQHHEQQRQHRPEHAELGPALDHLRDAQFRSLGGVGGHEYRPDQRADDDCQCAPEQVEPHHHRQHTRGDGGDVHVGAEPDEKQ